MTYEKLLENFYNLSPSELKEELIIINIRNKPTICVYEHIKNIGIFLVPLN